MQQAQATAQSNRYSAQVSETNAKIAEMNAQLADRRAKDALERGAKDEQQKRRETSALLGKQQAAMAANGVDITFGSPLDVLVDTSMLGELDALTIRSNTYREEHDYRIQGYNQRNNASTFRAEANMKRMAADNAETAGAIGAAGTLLGGIGGAYKSYKTGGLGSIA